MSDLQGPGALAWALGRAPLLRAPLREPEPGRRVGGGAGQGPELEGGGGGGLSPPGAGGRACAGRARRPHGAKRCGGTAGRGGDELEAQARVRQTKGRQYWLAPAKQN